MFRRIVFGFFLLVTCYLLPVTTYAQEFSTSYDVTYDIDETGVTTVTWKNTLKNLTSQYYADEFKLSLVASDLTGVYASDDAGPMEVSTSAQDKFTSITVKFNQEIAGLDKVLPWTLSFKSKDFVEKIGKIWEVRVPKFSSSTSLENYNLTISVPLSFGEPTAISPQPKSQTSSFGKRNLIFDKDQVKTSGVSANFGTNQHFDFDLTYHLENNNLVSILTNIALPPDTAYQDVVFQNIVPKPINVTLDEDGNYLAWYKLGRGEKLDVSVAGSVKLYTRTKVKNSNLPQALREKYTQGNKYWEKDNPQIQAKLREILGEKPPGSNVEKVRLIYKFVVENLKYDSGRVENIDNSNYIGERLGAVTALNNPASAVCIEFTDLFIALARAAGIPARELDGFAYTTNPKLRPLSLTKDILHAWPEYWDDKLGWVMVDPTWENTTGGTDYFNKLDLNHFVLAVKGVSSEQPIPAGSYKLSGTGDTRNVKVKLSEKDFLGEPQPAVLVDVSSQLFSGFPAKFKVTIVNKGSTILPETAFLVGAGRLNIINGQQRLGPVPAFGSASFEYEVRTGNLFDSYDDTISVLVGGQKFTREVLVRPFIIFKNLPFIVLGVVALLGIYGLILGGFIYKKRSYKKTVSKK